MSKAACGPARARRRCRRRRRHLPPPRPPTRSYDGQRIETVFPDETLHGLMFLLRRRTEKTRRRITKYRMRHGYRLLRNEYS